MQIEVFDHTSSWIISWASVQLRLRLINGDLLCQHFGRPQDYAPREMSFFGDPLAEAGSVARVHFAPGDRPIAWEAAGWSQPDEQTFALSLRGRLDPLAAEVRFIHDPASGVVRCQTRLSHSGDADRLAISAATSFSVTLPESVGVAVYLSGVWGGETQTRRVPISFTPIQVESRAGKTGYEFSPYLAALAPDCTYVFELGWSGNWQMNLRRQFNGVVQVSGGLNAWGLRHTLRPGDTLNLPDALLLCVAGDLNTTTHRLHDYRRSTHPDPDRYIPVQFNSWYPYIDQFNAEKLKKTAEDAARLGCEVFVLDAGWYTLAEPPGNPDWYERVGDWVVNPALFPNGVEELSTTCARLGLAFGMWFEPESSSPGSIVQRQHPQWLHTLGGRLIPHGRYRDPSRGIVNLGIPEARAFQRDRIVDHLRANRATWMKWDYNINLNQGGWADGLPDDLTHQDPLVAHYEGVYTLMDEIRAALPDLTLEGCAGGGGRIDAEITTHSHTHWASDEVNTLRRLAITFGAHLAHPAIECNNWLVDWPPHQVNPHVSAADQRGDLAFRVRAAMMGTFGISAPTGQWSDRDFELVGAHVQWYRDIIRPIIHSGDQYLLTEAPPLDGNGEWAAIWYVARNASGGVLFAFRLASRADEQVFMLPGLRPDQRYSLRSFDGAVSSTDGRDLGTGGVTVSLGEPFRSALLVVKQTTSG